MIQINDFSPIVAGTMLWGQWGRKLETSDMADLIKHCVQHQITSFDHADIYGGYTTEADFGKAFSASGVERSTIQLISKCGIKMLSDNRDHRIKHYDYTQEHIIQSCENSLQNLQTDYLDLFLLHRPSPLMDGAIIASAVQKLLSQGKILSFGLSNFTPAQSALIRQFIPISHNQIDFSITNHLPLTNGSLDDMVIHNTRPMAWAPLGSIFKQTTAQTERVVQVLGALEKKYSVGQDILLYNWIMRHPSKIIPVVGTGQKSRIALLSKAWSFQMEQEDWFELWEASMGNRVP